MKSRISNLITASAVLIAAVTLFAQDGLSQGRYVGQYSKADVDNIIRRVEDSGDEFRRDFRRELDRSNLSSSQKRTYRSQVDAFERSSDRLRSHFNSQNNWWNSRSQVQNLLNDSYPLNNTMNSIGFRRNIERQWNRLRNDINTLADTYDLPGLEGGGWWGGGGGGWNPGIGRPITPPNWAQGTFYGQAPDGNQITLTINNTGYVSVLMGGNMSYGTFISGNRLYINGNTSVVTRMGDGILTTGTDGLRIMYGRSGWGGGGGPGWGGGQQVSPPSWARGTFYGIAQDGTPITLTIASNGAVTANIGGSMSYGSFIRGNQLSIGGNVSNVTRLSNGIRTTLVGGGVVIDYRRR